MINVMDLQPGDKIRLRGDIIAEVVSNPRDGMWVVARYLAVPENSVQTEEMVFAEDIVDLA